MEPIRAYIYSIQGEYAFLNISTDTNGKLSNFKQKVRLNSIKFKNEPAPRALLTENTPAFCKLNGNTITEAYIDPDLEIFVVFGKIISVDSNNQSLTVSDDFNSNEISWNIFKSSDSRKIAQNIILNSIGSPVIIYYNLDSVIECKSAEESKEFSLTLDDFKRSKYDGGREEKEVFCFKDNRLILHKIAAKRVFFRNSNIEFKTDLVRENLRVRVKIFIKNREFRAEVAVDPPNNINIKYSKDGLDIISKKVDRWTGKSKNKRKSDKVYDITRTICPFQVPSHFNNQQKLYGKRIFDSSVNYYCKPNENFKGNFMVLLGLFEIVFRFPEHMTRNILYQQLIQESQKIGNSGLKTIINESFQIYRDQRMKTRIEELYQNLIENKNIYLELINNLIKNPLNYDELAEIFEISFWVKNSNNEWKSYYPFTYEGSSFPFIMIKDSPEFCILYSGDMMLFDGYDLKSLEYTNPQNLDPEKLKYQYQPQSPNKLELFQNILDLVSFSSEHVKGSEEKFYELIKKLNCSLKTLSDSVKLEQFSALSEIYKKITQVKVKDLSCLCGIEENCKFFCDNKHFLCKKCALVSASIGKCLYCEAKVKIDISGELYECTKCKCSYAAIQYFGFPCSCIYCASCVDEFIQGKYCMVHFINIPENIISPIYRFPQQI